MVLLHIFSLHNADDVIAAIREDSHVQTLTHIVELYGKILS